MARRRRARACGAAEVFLWTFIILPSLMNLSERAQYEAERSSLRLSRRILPDEVLDEMGVARSPGMKGESDFAHGTSPSCPNSCRGSGLAPTAVGVRCLSAWRSSVVYGAMHVSAESAMPARNPRSHGAHRRSTPYGHSGLEPASFTQYFESSPLPSQGSFASRWMESDPESDRAASRGSWRAVHRHMPLPFWFGQTGARSELPAPLHPQRDVVCARRSAIAGQSDPHGRLVVQAASTADEERVRRELAPESGVISQGEISDVGDERAAPRHEDIAVEAV